MAVGKQCGLRSWAVVAFMVFCGIPHLQAATIYVSKTGNDANYGLTWATAKRTVRAGLNAAVSGDRVWVAAGTYVEKVTLKNGVALYGGFAGNEDPASFDLADRDFTVNPTILDGNQTGSVVTAPQNATARTRIDGFTIRNGNATDGGGIHCNSYSSPTIANNTITANTARSRGGGICCYQDSSPTIANNTIMGNSASSGGGISCSSSSSPTIANNTITQNSSSYGGGICCGAFCSPTIANNTITGNIARDGGGICCLGGLATIANTIIAFNSSGIYNLEGTPTLWYNCVYGNTAYNYSGITDPTGTDGNISADPRFVQIDPGTDGIWGTADDDYSDLRLLADSPCIDAGDSASVPAGIMTDLGGVPRFLDNPDVPDTGNGTPPIVDMGAYEYLRGDIDGDGFVNVFDIFVIAECWNTQVGDPTFDPRCDLDGDGAVNVFDIFVIAENWNG